MILQLLRVVRQMAICIHLLFSLLHFSYFGSAVSCVMYLSTAFFNVKSLSLLEFCSNDSLQLPYPSLSISQSLISLTPSLTPTQSPFAFFFSFASPLFPFQFFSLLVPFLFCSQNYVIGVDSRERHSMTRIPFSDILYRTQNRRRQGCMLYSTALQPVALQKCVIQIDNFITPLSPWL